MKTVLYRLFVVFGLSVLFAQANAASEKDVWPHWRGPTQNGVIPDGTPPLEWSEEKNIKWKTKVPGSGLATPILWGDRIFLVTAVETADKNEAAPAEQGGNAGGQNSGGFNREAVMKEFDKNGDGQLNDEERAAMRAKFGGGRRRGGGGAGGGAASGGRRGGGNMSVSPQQEYGFQVIALDRQSGDIVWSQTARSLKPHEGHHPTHGFASASPVTDGERLWVSFGSRGLYCYEFDGTLVWDLDLGDMRTRNGFGEGASPVLAGNLLIVNWDHEDQSFVVALDKNTGKEVWRQNRDEVTSWTTPFVADVNGGKQVILAGSNKTRSYDVATGELIWEASGLTSNVIPTPVIGNDLVYVMSGYRGRSVQAIKLSSKGDVSDSSNIVWSAAHSAPYVASPVLSGNRLYMNKANDAYLTCFNALTGEVHYRDEPLDGMRGIYASPIAANGYLYVMGKEGTTVVIKDSETFEIAAKNVLDDKIDASPVIVGNELFIRGHENLYCISNDT